MLCVSSAMHESSKNVQACLADMYEPEWDGKREVDSIVEVSEFFYFPLKTLEFNVIFHHLLLVSYTVRILKSQNSCQNIGLFIIRSKNGH